MSIEWDDTLSAALKRISGEARFLADDVGHGAEVILKDAKDRVPKAPKKAGDEHPHLRDTGRIVLKAGKNNAVDIKFSGPYAAYIHESLWFKHPHGGEAKYLELALISKGQEAINEAGRHFWRRVA